MDILTLIILFLVSTVIVVPISHRLNLGAVLGYLIAGMIIGPSGFGFVKDTESIFRFSEFGVIFLMFVIGLELQPSRLWVLRRSVFGLGAAQLLATTGIVWIASLLFGLSWQAGLVLGLGLSMSSTALVLQSLAERQQLPTQHGRDAFAILLFQDLAVIPILALLPLLSPGESSNQGIHWPQVALSVLTIVAFVVLGRWLLRPAFKWIAKMESREMFTVASLLIVMGAALLMSKVGLSMGLGAFLSGVLLSDSEFRHELEADIDPFKGLLLGLFFISIGMSARIGLIWENPIQVIGLVLALYFVKGAALYGIKKVLRAHGSSSRKLALYLSQGGEFAFVLFSAALAARIFNAELTELFVIVVTISMLLAPFLFAFEDRFLSRKLDRTEAPKYDTEFNETSVVIAGFGRFGQIVGRLLTLRKIKFTALDKSSAQVEFVRRFGNKTFYGDATRLDVLESAKVGSAKLFILAIDDVEASLQTAELVRRHFPHVPIFARARNRFHSYKLLDLGITVLYRDTFFSSLEMGKKALEFFGFDSQSTEQMVTRFQEYDEELLHRQHAIYQNETQLIQTTRQALSDLETLFETDAKEAEIR